MKANWSWQFILKETEQYKEKEAFKVWHQILGLWQKSSIYKENTLQKGFSSYSVHSPKLARNSFGLPELFSLKIKYIVFPFWNQFIAIYDLWIDLGNELLKEWFC